MSKSKRPKRARYRKRGAIDPDRMQTDIIATMRAAGTPPEIVYAFKKTGLLLMEHTPATPDDRAEWDAAIAEYFSLERAHAGDRKPLKLVPQGDGPPPTNIPELKARPLSKGEFAQVVESLTALDKTLDRPVTLIARLEMAAAMLASVLASASEVPTDDASPEELRDLFEWITVQRARELFERSGD